jgi:hypothetical protein
LTFEGFLALRDFLDQHDDEEEAYEGDFRLEPDEPEWDEAEPELDEVEPPKSELDGADEQRQQGALDAIAFEEEQQDKVQGALDAAAFESGQEEGYDADVFETRLQDNDGADRSSEAVETLFSQYMYEEDQLLYADALASLLQAEFDWPNSDETDSEADRLVQVCAHPWPLARYVCSLTICALHG